MLCKVKDEYGDEQLYDLQPSGAIHPHGMPSKLVNELINTFPKAAIDALKNKLPAYVSKYTQQVKNRIS